MMDATSTFEFNLEPTDFWDNGYIGKYARELGGYYFSNFAARVKFNSLATVVEITVFNNEPADAASISVRLNGADYTNVVCSFEGFKTLRIELPAGEKIVELVEGGQDKTATLATGTFLVRAVFNAKTELLAPSFSKRAIIYGDSISAGAHADIRPLEGWSVLFRHFYGDSTSTLIEGWGSRALKDDGGDSTSRQLFADQLASYRPQDIILFIGTNDFGIPNRWDAGSFGQAYADLLVKLRLALPNATIHCYSPLLRRQEGPNEFGNTLDDYRAEIRKASAARPGVNYRDGKTLLTLEDMAADGTHPSTAGHARLARLVKDHFGL